MSETPKRQGQDTHNQQLLLALSQAAQQVHRARTPEAIYQAVGAEVKRLGYHALILTLDDDRQALKVDYLSIDSGPLKGICSLFILEILPSTLWA